MVTAFLQFILYSFLGFLLEVAFARLRGIRDQGRKCLLFLPLCPVYGLGGAAILHMPPLILAQPLWVFLAGGLLATLVEYAVGLFYELGAGVRFWDYDRQPGNLGAASAPFSPCSGVCWPASWSMSSTLSSPLWRLCWPPGRSGSSS